VYTITSGLVTQYQSNQWPRYEVNIADCLIKFLDYRLGNFTHFTGTLLPNWHQCFDSLRLVRLSPSQMPLRVYSAARKIDKHVLYMILTLNHPINLSIIVSCLTKENQNHPRGEWYRPRNNLISRQAATLDMLTRDQAPLTRDGETTRCVPSALSQPRIIAMATNWIIGKGYHVMRVTFCPSPAKLSAIQTQLSNPPSENSPTAKC